MQLDQLPRTEGSPVASIKTRTKFLPRYVDKLFCEPSGLARLNGGGLSPTRTRSRSEGFACPSSSMGAMRLKQSLTIYFYNARCSRIYSRNSGLTFSSRRLPSSDACQRAESPDGDQGEDSGRNGLWDPLRSGLQFHWRTEDWGLPLKNSLPTNNRLPQSAWSAPETDGNRVGSRTWTWKIGLLDGK